ncbi:amidohydrolase [Roseateles koreensis]|uniref:Amidohydrolase n=1 Tax=Roseateles koreensis TaxID=2987526 RepID=A0ABT5KP99_9BURK|nr:amidohydrolase [Roseateles koreensis]MDC8784270.1 amidohydrolase [Roseateles koreensis]
MNFLRTTVASAAVMTCFAGVALAQSEPATIFTAKKIITMEHSNPEAQAVAVLGKRIVSVGSLAQVKVALGDKPFVMNETFKDQVIMPGLIEQHVHPMLVSLTLNTDVISTEDWDLPTRTYPAAKNPEQYMKMLTAYSESKSDPQEWLYSWGYHKLWHGNLTRADLDKISTTRPIAVIHRSAHEVILNSVAMKTLGLDESAMRGKGVASEQYNWDEGHWWETGSFELVVPKLMKFMAAPARLKAGHDLFIEINKMNGVTSFNDPGVILAPGLIGMYKAMFNAPDVPFYSSFIGETKHQVYEGMTDAEALADTEKLHNSLPDGGKATFLKKQIKLYADGAIVSLLMQMNDGYSDGHKGEWILTPEQLDKISKPYWDAGYQLHVHATGDGGVDAVLNMVEKRMRENPRADHRTVLVHFANSTEAQIDRIARLGVIVSANPYYPVGFADKFSKSSLGKERADNMVRAQSVIRRGLHLSLHTDAPIAPMGPLYLAWAAVNRTTLDGRLVAPEQRISVDDALRAVTIEAAYSLRQENDLGSIAVGKIANFSVLGQDPYKVKPMTIKDIPIRASVFEGRVFPIAQRDKKPSKTASAPAAPFAKLMAALERNGPHGDICDVNKLLMVAFAKAEAERATTQ